MERTNNALRTPFFFNENNESKKRATVSVAVISGAKFAQPNGVRLKYEKVSFTLSVGDVAKIQTAPTVSYTHLVKLAALIMVSSSLKIDTEIRFYICNIGTLYPKVNSA